MQVLLLVKFLGVERTNSLNTARVDSEEKTGLYENVL